MAEKKGFFGRLFGSLSSSDETEKQVETPQKTSEEKQSYNQTPQKKNVTQNKRKPQQRAPQNARQQGKGRAQNGKQGPNNKWVKLDNTASQSRQNRTQPMQPGKEISIGVRSRTRNTQQQKATPQNITVGDDGISSFGGSTRLMAKEQRAKNGRMQVNRAKLIAEADFLASRENVDRKMLIREIQSDIQIAILEDGILVEHYISKQEDSSVVSNVYYGRVENVLPSMEAAFVDIGSGRNAILYAEAVNWDDVDVIESEKKIETALKVGDSILVQATKDPIGRKGARLTTQIMLTGRYFVLSPMNPAIGVSHKLPTAERNRLTSIVEKIERKGYGLIVRTAAAGVSEEDLNQDFANLANKWDAIQEKLKTASAPQLLQNDADMPIRVVRDIFNDTFNKLVIQSDHIYDTIHEYISSLNSDLLPRIEKWAGKGDIFAEYNVVEQLSKALDRRVWLPSGGTLILDKTEAMTVIDVNTGKFTGSGGSLEETVTSNNLEAAEEIVRQLRLRDIGGIVVVDFIDMVLENNRELVLRRLIECLARDKTKHHVAEVTSLGLIQITRKRVGQGLIEAFSNKCTVCNGKGYITNLDELERNLQSNEYAESQVDAPTPAAVPKKRTPKRVKVEKPAKPVATAEKELPADGYDDNTVIETDSDIISEPSQGDIVTETIITDSATVTTDKQDVTDNAIVDTANPIEKELSTQQYEVKTDYAIVDTDSVNAKNSFTDYGITTFDTSLLPDASDVEIVDIESTAPTQNSKDIAKSIAKAALRKHN
ncbi:MAG: Rne/Rng family ribonuclease [Bifidobacteriaceae bacterium]|jgi:ribonuclease E|nr:Rne/Rng family ribonuclease [Bifidobacteriaceae bacterium]